MALGNDVLTLLASVELVTDLLEVVLHHIDVVFIVLEINSWVLNQQNSELVEAFSDFLTLNSDIVCELAHVCFTSFEVNIHVNNGDILEVVSN